MKLALIIIVGSYLFMSLVYLGYLGIARLNIALKTNPEKVNKAVKILATPAVIIFVLADVLLNVVFGTLMFLQLPKFKKLLFTARLSDNANNGRGFRKSLAKFWCRELLDRFDHQGRHCDCHEGSEGEACQE